RVVQDQLKVSEGWVRCGRCNEVFNALEGLFDLERDTPPQEVSGAASAPRSAAVQASAEPFDIEVDIAAAATAGDPSLIDKIDAQLLAPRRSEAGSTPATRIGERDRLEFPDAQFDPESPTDDTAVDADDAPAWSTPSTPESTEPTAPAAAPEFVRRAQRAARWQRPKVRAALVGVALVLAVSLALQAGHHFRNLISARWPETRPLLAAWCAARSCAIEAPQRIDDVSVESTALTRASAPDVFKLSVALRNHGALTVALPSVDLSLTDPNGQLVARRVLTPRDFGVALARLQPGGDANLQLLLTAGGEAQVTGYTVEIFYP
ncbi:MAG: zinc-ribbon and DUF3426 domain-containing protein, partial [Burkholderiales bacterium]|nr:zinc-ribbon and DUF3426 domain-containing protein [Burkholderiales bacterium]